MDGKQYEQVVHNQRGYNLQPLFASESLQAVLRRAARAARQRQSAEEAWQRVVNSQAAAQCSVISYRDGVMLMSASDPTVCHYFQSGAVELRRRLAAFLPGLRELRFIKDSAGPGVPGDRPG